jgi:hypothetical protein
MRPCVRRARVTMAHPIYNIDLHRFARLGTLSGITKRIGWVYYLRGRQGTLAAAEVSWVSGVHRNARLTEGRSIGKGFRLLAKTRKDKRIRKNNFRLRFLRVEALHFVALWLKGAGRSEYFIPVATLNSLLGFGKWYSRQQLVEGLAPKASKVIHDHKLLLNRPSRRLPKQGHPERAENSQHK